MATDIPPHNLREIASACIHLLDEPGGDARRAVSPREGRPIFRPPPKSSRPRASSRRCTRAASARCAARAVYKHEDGNVVITALPFQVSGERLFAQVAEQMRAKKLPMLEDLRDESDHENPVRLVLIPRSNRIDLDEMMQHLFATTDLEHSYRINLNIIGLDGKPQVKNLKQILIEWLRFRQTTVTAPPAASPRQSRAPAAHARSVAHRVPQSRRSDPHRPQRGGAKAGADPPVQTGRRAGRLHPRDEAAPARAARGDEDSTPSATRSRRSARASP